MQIPRNEFAYKFQGILQMGQKSYKQVLVEIWVVVFTHESSHHLLQTFRQLRIFKIVFRDRLLNWKQFFILSVTADQRMRRPHWLHQWRLVVKLAGRAAKFHLWLQARRQDLAAGGPKTR